MRRFAAILSSAFVVLPVSCNDAGPPPVTPKTTVIVDGGPLVAASGAEASPTVPISTGDGGADFYSCTVDSDCVAVQKVGCCPNGTLEAVNKQSADAYAKSFVCEGKRHICPMYRLLDRRQPICSSTSHRCEMVQPDQINCSGTGPNVHACATGSQCDSSGHCTPTAP